MKKCQHSQLKLKMGGYVCKQCSKVIFDINEVATKEWLIMDIRNETKK